MSEVFTQELADEWAAFIGWGEDMIAAERARDPAAWHPVAQALMADLAFRRAFGRPTLALEMPCLSAVESDTLILLPAVWTDRISFSLHAEEGIVRAAAPFVEQALRRKLMRLWKAMPPMITPFALPGRKTWWRAGFHVTTPESC